MHFMGGRIFMSLEENKILVHLEKEENKDYLVFKIDDDVRLCLNDDSNQNELRSIFSIILNKLVSNQLIKLEFVDNPEYTKGLYIDVCKEYIKDLNREIAMVVKSMPEKLLNNRR